MDELHDSVADALIDICYGYQTEGLIAQLCDVEVAVISAHERKVLDVLLSCIGMAAALYVLRSRYGEESRQFGTDVQVRLRHRLTSAGLPPDAVSFQMALIDRSFLNCSSIFRE